MAELVGAFGVPHMPNTPLSVRQSPTGELAQLFGAVRDQVDAVDPHVLVVFDTDHFATWYYQKLPVFAIGVADRTSGPGPDDWPGLTCFEDIPVAEDVGRAADRRDGGGGRAWRTQDLRRRLRWTPLDLLSCRGVIAIRRYTGCTRGF